MQLRFWHWLLAVAALVVPLQAVALDGGGGGGGSLSASASLGYCGVTDAGVSCRIDVSWSGLEDAQRYTASATLADGSVRDLGTVGIGSGGGSTSVWVPYVGSGTYSIAVTAWGNDDDGDKKKLDTSKAKAVSSKEPGSSADAEQDGQNGDEGEPDEPAPPADPPNTTKPDGPPADEPPGTQPPPDEPEPEPAPEPKTETPPEPQPEPEPTPEQGGEPQSGAASAPAPKKDDAATAAASATDPAG